MDDYYNIARVIIALIFVIFIPCAVIYFRIKKKIKTGFAVGLIMTSLLLGVITYSSVRKDPVEEFITLFNDRQFDEAKRAYKIIIQYGPDYIGKVDAQSLIYHKQYKNMINEIIHEYSEIISRYLNTYDINECSDCSHYRREKKKLGYLNHAKRLFSYAESLGYKNEFNKKRLDQKIKIGSERLSVMKEECE